MRGQLSIGTGIPSHGKSNFTDDYVINLINDYDLKASWFSPEHSPMQLYHTNLSEKVTGKNFWGKVNGQEVNRVTKEELTKYKEWGNEKIYLTDCEAGQLPTWDWLLKKFEEQMYSFGIDIFVIDAFNKVLLPKGNKLEEINIVLTKLTHFAQSNNVIVFLVAHPTKMQKNEQGIYGVPTLYDVSGSADFRNQTHNGYTIYRHFYDEQLGIENETEFYNMKTKFNFQGEIGSSVKFKYCLENGRFYIGNEEPLNPLWEKEEDKPKQERKVLPLISAEDAFNGIDF
jgi:twinkle protein